MIQTYLESSGKIAYFPSTQKEVMSKLVDCFNNKRITRRQINLYGNGTPDLR
jgi:hypothetical protein